MRHPLSLLALVLLAACGGDKTGGTSAAVEAKVTDSSGVSLWEYSQASWDAAPQIALSAAPLLTIGGEEGDTTLDLSAGIMGAAAASVGRLLPDGRIAIVAGQPPQIMLIDTMGRKSMNIGRAGEGPGEYRMPTQLLMIGGDTLLAFDVMRRKGVLFGLDGSSRGERDFPVAGQLPIAPQIIGVLNDGTSIHRMDGFDPTPPAGGDKDSYQLPLPIVALIPGGARYDTLFVTKGVEMYSSTMTFQGETAAIPRQIGFGVTPLVTVGSDAIWMTPAKTFELQRRSSGGALMQIIRVALPPRAVTPADQEEFKRVFKDALERLKSMAPPALIDAEIKKLDETRFATSLPAVAQLVVAADGALWANVGGSPLDTTTTWGVFGTDGKLQGRVTLPKGTVFAVGSDRVIVRREDPETGLIRLEVWGLTR
jgi:hypothetical protein